MQERGNDVSYTAARFIGICHSKSPGDNLSLGTWNAPKSEDKIKSEEYSHGDAGVFIVRVASRPWSIESYNGYGLDKDEY